MKKRLYLDNCSFNRPYDNYVLLKNYLQAEAKIYIQKEILNGNFDLVWSYVLDFEASFNPFSDRKSQILKWKNIAKADIDESEKIIAMANSVMKKNIKPKDALHLACAISAQCDYFITTDSKLLNKVIEGVTIIDPIDFIKALEIPQ